MKKNKKQTYEINDYIGVFKNFADDVICDGLLDSFSKEEKFQRVYGRVESEGSSPFDKKDTSCIVNKDTFELSFQDVSPLFKIAMENVLSIYIKKTKILDFIGNDEGLKWCPFKIQRTDPSGGYHKWHTEHDYKTRHISRVLVFTVYLNDIKEGGETEFLIQKQRVSPEKGTICIFPATFPYVHRGNPPLKGTKYIATGWFVANFY